MINKGLIVYREKNQIIALLGISIKALKISTIIVKMLIFKKNNNADGWKNS